MKTLTIGDIHGLDVWKNIKKKADEYDKIIFVGDYVDAQFIPSSQILDNLKDVLAFKEEYEDKVVLLIGNHDVQYMMGEMQSSGYDEANAAIYKQLLKPDILQVAYQVGSYLWTHAGINSLWKEKHLLATEKDQYADKLNEMFRDNDGKRHLLEVGPRRGGIHESGGPLWCDYSEIKAYPVSGLVQIFGHTPVYKIETTKGDNYKLVNCNCLPIQTDFYELEIIQE